MNASATNDSKGDDPDTKFPSIRIPPPAPCGLTSLVSYGNGVVTGILRPLLIRNGPVIDEQFCIYGDVVMYGRLLTGAGIDICGTSVEV